MSFLDIFKDKVNQYVDDWIKNYNRDGYVVSDEIKNLMLQVAKCMFDPKTENYTKDFVDKSVILIDNKVMEFNGEDSPMKGYNSGEDIIADALKEIEADIKIDSALKTLIGDDYLQNVTKNKKVNQKKTKPIKNTFKQTKVNNHKDTSSKIKRTKDEIQKSAEDAVNRFMKIKNSPKKSRKLHNTNLKPSKVTRSKDEIKSAAKIAVNKYINKK